MYLWDCALSYDPPAVGLRENSMRIESADNKKQVVRPGPAPCNTQSKCESFRWEVKLQFFLAKQCQIYVGQVLLQHVFQMRQMRAVIFQIELGNFKNLLGQDAPGQKITRKHWAAKYRLIQRKAKKNETFQKKQAALQPKQNQNPSS